MTAHIAFDPRSLIWGFGESCTIVQGINWEPEQNVLSSVLYWHFCLSLTVWLQFQRGTFRPTCLGLGGVGSRDRPIRQPVYGLLLVPPLTRMVYPLPLLSYLAGCKRVSARPTRIRWQIPLRKLSLRRVQKSVDCVSSNSQHIFNLLVS